MHELTWWEGFGLSTGDFVDLATLLEDVATINQLELQVTGDSSVDQEFDQLA